MKIMMFLSILIQLALINLFLGTWDIFWGFNILWQIVVDGLHDHFPTIQDTRKFIREFLKIDDVVILRMINSNVGYLQTSDILHQLWLNYNSIEDIEKK
uniref:Innexin n=1 Tax=Meloidogyne hapla TaxID=6305 RepID=A0A1I8BIU9_MELHA